MAIGSSASQTSSLIYIVLEIIYQSLYYQCKLRTHPYFIMNIVILWTLLVHTRQCCQELVLTFVEYHRPSAFLYQNLGLLIVIVLLLELSLANTKIINFNSVFEVLTRLISAESLRRTLKDYYYLVLLHKWNDFSCSNAFASSLLTSHVVQVTANLLHSELSLA